MSGLPPRQPPAQQALAPPQWATSLTLAERESVIAKITERLRALVASGVPTENVRRAAVHLEAAAFQHATSMEDYLATIRRKIQEAGAKVAAVTSASTTSSAASSSAMASSATPSVAASIAASPRIGISGVGMPGMAPLINAVTTQGTGAVIAMMNGQRTVVFGQSAMMPVLELMSENERVVVRQRLARLQAPLAKYFPLAQQMLANRARTPGTPPTPATDPFVLINRVGQIMEHQVALLQKHDYFLSARHLDRLEPQFLGACQQVESVLRALGQQQQNTDGVNIMKPVAATGETVSTPSTVSVTTAASVPATPSKRPSSPETDSMAARLKALRDKDPFAYMAVTTAEFEQATKGFDSVDRLLDKILSQPAPTWPTHNGEEFLRWPQLQSPVVASHLEPSSALTATDEDRMFQQRFARPSPRNSDIDEWTSPPPLNDDELEEMLPMAVDGPIILETNSGCSVTLSAQCHTP